MKYRDAADIPFDLPDDLPPYAPPEYAQPRRPVAEPNGQDRLIVAEQPPEPEEDLTSWLERASALLTEPDPGPTPFLVEELIVDRAIATLVGAPKVGKTWDVLELAVAIVTGRDAFGRFPVPKPGPVILIVEESGRAALHRRLDALARGYAIDPAALRDLHLAANRRVRLNDFAWQCRLLEAGRTFKPRAIFLDPLVRLKGADVDENLRRDIGPVLDFMRTLRDEANAAVVFVHHMGHEGARLRGSSDLEGYWESKITVARADDGVLKLSAQHREAEASAEFRYRLSFDVATRSVRLAPLIDPKREARIRADVEAFLEANPGASKNAVADAVRGRRQKVLRIADEVLAGAPTPVPEPGNHPEPPGSAPPPPVAPPDGPPPVGRGLPGTTALGAVPDDAELAEADRIVEKHRDVAGGEA